MDKNQTHILGSKIDHRSPHEVRGFIHRWLQSNRQGTPHHIVTLNPEICLLAEHNETYRRKVLNKADLTVRDGFGLSIGASILGTHVPERITGRKLMSMILSESVQSGASIYFIGGKDNTAEKAAASLKKRFPQLSIAGAEVGLSLNEFSLDSPDLVNRINASKAEVLFVAFGAPKQEQWIKHNLSEFDSLKLVVGIGGLLDYISGNVPNPPKIIQKLGLEWLFRLFTQKGRLKRIISATIVFPWRCLVWRYRMAFQFRFNTVGVIQNSNQDVLLVTPAWSQTYKWQFPQGGVDDGEDAQTAIIREMTEELGTNTFELSGHYPDVYSYQWPKWYQLLRGYKGQKQDLFFLNFTGTDKDIDITKEGELAAWKWSPKENILDSLAPARKEIGSIVLNIDKNR